MVKILVVIKFFVSSSVINIFGGSMTGKIKTYFNKKRAAPVLTFNKRLPIFF
jgi:hypothetical protein